MAAEKNKSTKKSRPTSHTTDMTSPWLGSFDIQFVSEVNTTIEPPPLLHSIMFYHVSHPLTLITTYYWVTPELLVSGSELFVFHGGIRCCLSSRGVSQCDYAMVWSGLSALRSTPFLLRFWWE